MRQNPAKTRSKKKGPVSCATVADMEVDDVEFIAHRVVAAGCYASAVAGAPWVLGTTDATDGSFFSPFPFFTLRMEAASPPVALPCPLPLRPCQETQRWSFTGHAG